jgi:hypothetical protein
MWHWRVWHLNFSFCSVSYCNGIVSKTNGEKRWGDTRVARRGWLHNARHESHFIVELFNSSTFYFLEPIFICTQLISTIYSYEFLGPVSITFFFNPASVNWNATRQSSLYFQLRYLSHFMDKEFVRLIITVSVFSFFVSSFPILHLIT